MTAGPEAETAVAMRESARATEVVRILKRVLKKKEGIPVEAGEERKSGVKEERSELGALSRASGVLCCPCFDELGPRAKPGAGAEVGTRLEMKPSMTRRNELRTESMRLRATRTTGSSRSCGEA